MFKFFLYPYLDEVKYMVWSRSYHIFLCFVFCIGGFTSLFSYADSGIGSSIKNSTSALRLATVPLNQPLHAFPYLPGFDTAFIDKNVDPCNDFFAYACNGWIQANPIPADEDRWNVDNKTYQYILQFLWGILEDVAHKSGSKTLNEQKLGDYFASCMDEAIVEKEGLAPIAQELALVENMYALNDLPKVLGKLHQPLFKLFASEDTQDTSQTIAMLRAGGMGLPGRSYYLDPKRTEAREKYVKYIEHMLAFAGISTDEAQKQSQTIVKIESALSEGMLTSQQQREPQKSEQRMKIKELQALTPSFSWQAYFASLGAPSISVITVEGPQFFQGMEVQLTKIPFMDWKTYLRWVILDHNAPYLSEAFVEEHFSFHGKYLRGMQTMKPRWVRCIDEVNQHMGEALGQLFVKKLIPASAKTKTLQMVNQIQAVMAAHIQALSWMSEATKKQALIKLYALGKKIGYPEHYRDYSKLVIKAGDFLGNLKRSAEFETRRELAKIGKPINRAEWYYLPTDLEESYNFGLNEINFPAGNLLPPIYDPQVEDGLTFAKLGYYIGHEITHGFDDEGRHFDKDGNIRDWWTQEDTVQFEKRAECLVNQFNQYEVLPGVKVNGKLSLGENIADLGGLSLAYEAWKKYGNQLIGNQLITQSEFSEEQRFFIGFAQERCKSEREEYLRLQVEDPHPQAKHRANGVLANMPEFQQAFHCADSAPMVNKNRCKIW